jgi:hypothetical protein
LAIDINEYLPSDTLTWCTEQLAGEGINLPGLQEGIIKPDGSRLHVHAYHRLRDIVRRHIAAGNVYPRLHLCPKVRIGTEEVQRNGSRLGRLIVENYDFVQVVRQRELEANPQEVAEGGFLSGEESGEEGWDDGGVDERDILERDAQD